MDDRDIQTRVDIELLVNKFYQQAKYDDQIGHFFTEVIPLDWDHHIPLICDFWETVLLNRIAYQGNPMIKHLELHKKSPLLEKHFDRWLTLWEKAVSAQFVGPKATEAINRAQQIGALMKFKVSQL